MAYLNKLKFDEAKQLLYQNATIAKLLSEDHWDKNKLSGPKLVQLINGNELTTKKVKEGYGIDDS